MAKTESKTELELKAIRTYQAVTFEKSSVTFFTKHILPGKPRVELNYLKEFNAIEIKSTRDHIIVPVTNVSAMYLWTAADRERISEKAAESKKKKPQVKASEIKRPI